MILKCKPWDDAYRAGVIALWNEEAALDGYKEMTEDRFASLIQEHPYFDANSTYVMMDEQRVVGFSCCCTGQDLPNGDMAGYITCLIIARDYRSEQNVDLLVSLLEQRFKQLGKRQSEVSFLNPMRLPWYIPDTLNHEHNNMPGIPIESQWYPDMLRLGYMVRAEQCAMHLDLAQFQKSAYMATKEQQAVAAGYQVELFDSSSHSGVAEMLVSLNNPLWLREIGECTHNGVPVVIAAHEGQVVGFAGPVVRQENGRGYFAGIGVMPEHEGHGLGSVLFFKLCEAFKAIDTAYMSLFTGISNPALRIYERAGFKAVKHFAVMRREL